MKCTNKNTLKIQYTKPPVSAWSRYNSQTFLKDRRPNYVLVN